MTDDSFATVGADVQVCHEHATAVNETIRHENVKTQRGHRNHLKALIKWQQTEYPDYFEASTTVLAVLSQQE